LLVFTLAISSILIVACNSNAASPPATPVRAPQISTEQKSTATGSQTSAFSPQLNNENAVAVEVVPLNIAADGTRADFHIAFNTHSVPLDFDPVAVTVLRDGAGNEYYAKTWDGSAPGGHHRQGISSFALDAQPQQFIEVVIHDVANVPERTFHWNMP